VASDYRGLKKHIATVREQQETDDRKYRSSLYPGAPAQPHVLWFPIAGELPPSFPQRRPAHERTLGATDRSARDDAFRSSKRYSFPSPRRVKQPHTNVEAIDKTTAYKTLFHSPAPEQTSNPHLSSSFASVSSQSKTLCVPLQEIHPKVNDLEMEFLVKLDVELEKVDSFYLDREKEVKDM
jgi:hypothetical protein